MPAVIGASGVEQIVEIKLSDKEKEQFNLSIKAVENLYISAKNIDKDL